MLINQALSEVLQLVACQLFPLHAVVFACFRLLRKTESWHDRDRSGTETRTDSEDESSEGTTGVEEPTEEEEEEEVEEDEDGGDEVDVDENVEEEAN